MLIEMAGGRKRFDRAVSLTGVSPLSIAEEVMMGCMGLARDDQMNRTVRNRYEIASERSMFVAMTESEARRRI